MKKQTEFSIKNRIKSFTYAFNGLKILFETEHNARIHLLSVCFVSLLGFYYELSKLEWFMILVSFGLVFITETLNTSIEYLTDIVTPNYNEKAKKVKDLAAASVFIAAIFAVIIGLIVFLPKIC